MDTGALIGLTIFAIIAILAGWAIRRIFGAIGFIGKNRQKRQKDEVIARLDRIEKKLNEVLVCLGDVEGIDD